MHLILFTLMNGLMLLANKGVLLGLNDLIEKDQFDTSVYPESLLTPLRYENELYALPQRSFSICDLL